MSTDRELLELAAQAAGLLWQNWTPTIYSGEAKLREWPYDWNPLTDDGDALRLAVKLEIEVRNFNGKSHAGRQDKFWCTENWFPDGDRYAATRRAIVRAAAEIGRTL